jgi:AcrR family transcriptional regulator
MARPKLPLDPQRKKALVDAARDEFAANGFERSSLNRILIATDFSKSSFYHYFPDKEALFDAVLEAGVAELPNDLRLPDLAAATGDEFWECLREFDVKLQAIVSSGSAVLATGTLLHLADAPRTPTLVFFERRMLRELDRVLRAGRRNGAIDTTIPLALQRRLLIAVAIEADKWVLKGGVSGAASEAAFRAIYRLLAG